MSQPRKWLLMASVVFLAALVVWINLQRDPNAEVWEQYERIQPGMSKKEVIDLFGAPPGKYSTSGVAICTTGQDEAYDAVAKCSSKNVWVFDAGVFEVGFDNNSRVEKKVATANMGDRRSFWSRLLSLLGL